MIKPRIYDCQGRLQCTRCAQFRDTLDYYQHAPSVRKRSLERVCRACHRQGDVAARARAVACRKYAEDKDFRERHIERVKERYSRKAAQINQKKREMRVQARENK